MGYPKKVVIHLNVHIKETLQLFAGGWYVSIRIRLLFKNRLYFFFEFRQMVYHYAPENIG